MLTFRQYIKEISNIGSHSSPVKDGDFKDYPNAMADKYDEPRTLRIDPSVTTGGSTPKSKVIDPEENDEKPIPTTSGKYGIK